MSHRFFLKSPPSTSSIFLEGEQAHHAIQVMRFKKGDEIVLFDGSGMEYVASIDQIGKKQLELTIVESTSRPRELNCSITLAVALPKGDRQKFLVEKLVELGVACLVPLTTNRSVAVPNAKVIGRLQKQVIEASKQSGRNILMDIGEPHSLKQFVESTDPSITRLLANPYVGRPISSYVGQANPHDRLAAVIGPEGGFDDSENHLALELGFEPVRLGPTILRVETAALAIAVVLGIGTDLPYSE